MNIYNIGENSQAGTYTFLLHSPTDREIVFGGFKKGKIIPVKSGYYLYVGSALSKRGATALGNRLSRHCKKLPGSQEHEIRKHLLTTFDELSINYTKKPSDKKPFWNVDYLTTLEDSQIIGIIFIQSEEGKEHAWSEYFATLKDTNIFEKGLGANDTKNMTHLQAVNIKVTKNHFNVLKWWKESYTDLIKL